MTVDEFLKQEKNDPNLWWRLSSGEHQNLFEEAVGHLNDMRVEISLLQDKITNLTEHLEDLHGRPQ